VDVIRHHNNRKQINRAFMGSDAGLQDDVTGPIRQRPAMIRAESQEMRLIITLKVGKVAAVKGL
jgi:hypothetical protein